MAVAALLFTFHVVNSLIFDVPNGAISSAGADIPPGAGLLRCVMAHHVYASALLLPCCSECAVPRAMECATHVTVLACIYSAMSFAFDIEGHLGAGVGVGVLSAIVTTMSVRAFFDRFGWGGPQQRRPSSSVVSSIFNDWYASATRRECAYFEEPSNIDDTFLYEDYSYSGGHYELPNMAVPAPMPGQPTTHPDRGGGGWYLYNSDVGVVENDDDIDLQSLRWANTSLNQKRSEAVSLHNSDAATISINIASRSTVVDMNAASPGAHPDYFLEDVDIASLSTASWMFTTGTASPTKPSAHKVANLALSQSVAEELCAGVPTASTKTQGAPDLEGLGASAIKFDVRAALDDSDLIVATPPTSSPRSYHHNNNNSSSRNSSSSTYHSGSISMLAGGESRTTHDNDLHRRRASIAWACEEPETTETTSAARETIHNKLTLKHNVADARAPPAADLVAVDNTIADQHDVRIIGRLDEKEEGGGPDAVVDSRFAYWMSFYNFYLCGLSSVLFTGCFLSGTWPAGSTATASIVINLDSTVSLYDRSTFWIRNTTTTKVFMLHTSTLSSMVKI
jgi:hypothetical protein